MALITGSNLVQSASTLNRIDTGVTLSRTSTIAMRYGIGILVIGALVIVGGVVVSHPSEIARWLLVLLEVVMLGATLAAYFGGGSVLGFVTVLSLGASGAALLLPIGAVVGMQAAIIYLLGLHPPTYSAFAR